MDELLRFIRDVCMQMTELVTRTNTQTQLYFAVVWWEEKSYVHTTTLETQSQRWESHWMWAIVCSVGQSLSLGHPVLTQCGLNQQPPCLLDSYLESVTSDLIL